MMIGELHSDHRLSSIVERVNEALREICCLRALNFMDSGSRAIEMVTATRCAHFDASGYTIVVDRLEIAPI